MNEPGVSVRMEDITYSGVIGGKILQFLYQNIEFPAIYQQNFKSVPLALKPSLIISFGCL